MIQIIPHQTEILKFVNFQKKIISLLQDENLFLLQTIPLAISLNNNFESIENVKKAIISVEIHLPQIDEQKSKIFSKVKIKTNNQEILSEIQYIDFYENQSNQISSKTDFNKIDTYIKKICTETDFPCRLNIFRIVNTISENTDFSSVNKVSKSYWVKIKG